MSCYIMDYVTHNSHFMFYSHIINKIIVGLKIFKSPKCIVTTYLKEFLTNIVLNNCFKIKKFWF